MHLETLVRQGSRRFQQALGGQAAHRPKNRSRHLPAHRRPDRFQEVQDGIHVRRMREVAGENHNRPRFAPPVRRGGMKIVRVHRDGRHAALGHGRAGLARALLVQFRDEADHVGLPADPRFLPGDRRDESRLPRGDHRVRLVLGLPPQRIGADIVEINEFGQVGRQIIQPGGGVRLDEDQRLPGPLGDGGQQVRRAVGEDGQLHVCVHRFPVQS